MSCSRFGLLMGFAFFAGCASTPAGARGTSPGVASASTAFPRADAETALSAVRPGLRGCRRNPGASAVVFEATLEFEPSGKVGRVVIAPSGPVADCVRSDLAQVEIRSFDGPPIEVEMQLTL